MEEYRISNETIGSRRDSFRRRLLRILIAGVLIILVLTLFSRYMSWESDRKRARFFEKVEDFAKSETPLSFWSPHTLSMPFDSSDFDRVLFDRDRHNHFVIAGLSKGEVVFHYAFSWDLNVFALDGASAWGDPLNYLMFATPRDQVLTGLMEESSEEQLEKLRTIFEYLQENMDKLTAPIQYWSYGAVNDYLSRIQKDIELMKQIKGNRGRSIDGE